MKVTETGLPGVLLIEPRVFEDGRGFFMETWRESDFVELLGEDLRFVQDNHSRSTKGVLRGLHFQTRKPQGKLVRCVRGEIFDVAVDIRTDSPNFGQWTGTHLSDTNHHMLWVPPGFAHGFQVLSDVADVTYKCTDYYDPEGEGGLAWNDPDVAIEWPLEISELSSKDSFFQCLKDIF